MNLGFSLEQIRDLLAAGPPLAQLQGMLRLRQAELEQSVAEEQSRLRHVEAHLRAIERKGTVSTQDVLVSGSRTAASIWPDTAASSTTS